MGCLLAQQPDAAFGEYAVLRRAKLAIEKRSPKKERPRRFIQKEAVCRIVEVLVMDPKWKFAAMWILTAYVFLLRQVAGQ